MVYAFEDGGTAMVGVISLVLLIPAAMFAPIGSVLGDRFRRERLPARGGATRRSHASPPPSPCSRTRPRSSSTWPPAPPGWILSLIRPGPGSPAALDRRRPGRAHLGVHGERRDRERERLPRPGRGYGGVVVAEAMDISGPGLVFAILAALLAIGAVLVAGIGGRLRRSRATTLPSSERSARGSGTSARTDGRVSW